MSAAQIGGIMGAVLGLASFVGLRWVADLVEGGRDPGDGSGSSKVNIVRLVAIADLIIFPLVGYFVGPMVAGRA